MLNVWASPDLRSSPAARFEETPLLHTVRTTLFLYLPMNFSSLTSASYSMFLALTIWLAHVDHDGALIDEAHGIGSRHMGKPLAFQADFIKHNG
jgi:hypothetical protein